MEEMLTPTEVAEMLRVSRMTVYRIIARGELIGIHVGRQIRVPKSSMDMFLRKNERINES